MITASKAKISRAGPIDGIEIGADAEKDRGDRHHGERQPIADREDALVVDAHQLGDRRIVGDGAEGAADRRAVEELVQCDDDRDRGGERHQRHDADRQAGRQRQSRRFRDRPLTGAGCRRRRPPAGRSG